MPSARCRDRDALARRPPAVGSRHPRIGLLRIMEIGEVAEIILGVTP